jgi:hypothetical protein
VAALRFARGSGDAYPADVIAVAGAQGRYAPGHHHGHDHGHGPRVPGTTPEWRRGLMFLNRMWIRYLTFENSCRQGKLTFGDLFEDSGVVLVSTGHVRC